MKVDQSKFEKVLNHYNLLKHQWVDDEANRIEMYNRVAGKTVMEEEDRLKLESQRRPTDGLNFHLPVLLYLTGSQRQARSYMRAIPAEEGDEQTANILTKLMYWNFNKTWYEWEASKAGMHSMIGGIGWTNDWWDYLEGHWTCRAYDSLRIRFDINTQHPRLLDCRYLQDTQWATKEEIFAMCDDEETLEELKKNFKFLEPAPSTSFIDKAYGNAWGYNRIPRKGDWDYIDSREGRYRLIDHHEMVDEPQVALIDVQDPDKYEIVTDMPPEQVQVLFSLNPNFRRWEFNRKVFYHYIICPAVQMVVVDEPYPIQTGMYAFKPRFCYDIIPELKDRTGVFDNVKALNDGINKRRLTMLEYAMKSVNGSWIASKKAIAGNEHLWENDEIGVVKVYNDGADKPTRDFPLPQSQPLAEFQRDDIGFYEWISAVGKNARGFKESANESGVVVGRKLQQTETMFALLADNLEMAQKMDAKSCISHIQQAMTMARKVRVLDNKNKPEWLRVNWETIQGIENDITIGEYDVEVDSSRPSVTSQQLAFAQWADLLKTMPPQMQALVMDFVVETSDIPEKDVLMQRLKTFLKMTFGFDPDNPEQAMQQQAVQQTAGQMPAPTQVRAGMA